MIRTVYAYRLLEGQDVRWEAVSSAERRAQRSADARAALAASGSEVVD